MELGRLHHVAIIASDYETAKEFYVNKLGLPLLREVYRPEREDYILTLAAGDVEIELFIEKNPPLRVTNPEARGIETEPIRLDSFTGKAMTFFRDPDGLPLELHE